MNNFNELIAGNKPVLVDFFATWCGPCKVMHPIIDGLVAKVGNKASIIKIDVDQNQDLAAQFIIQTVPTFIIFKNGKPEFRHSGVILATELEKALEKYY